MAKNLGKSKAMILRNHGVLALGETVREAFEIMYYLDCSCQIQVDAPNSDNLVTVFRGVNRETYTCTPVCQKRITLGDGPDYFRSTLEQTGVLTSQASGPPPDSK